MRTEGEESRASEAISGTLPQDQADRDIVRRIASGTGWKLGGILASRIFSVVAMIAAARILGKPNFGALGMVQSTVGMFGVLAGLGLGVTATKYIAELRRKDTQRLGRILSLVLLTQVSALIVVGVVVVVLADALAAHTINAPQLAQEIRLAVALLAFLSLNRLATDALAGFEAWRLVAAMALAQGVVTLPAVLLLAPAHGVAGAVGGLSLAAAVSAGVGGWAVVQRCRVAGIQLRFRDLRSEACVLWHFSVPATLTALAVGPVLWAGNAILANTEGGYGQLGAFAASLQWKNLLMYVPAAMAAAFLPVMAHLHDANGSHSFDSALRAQIPLLGLVSLPPGILIACCGPYIMALYGDDFAGHELLLTIIVFGAVLQAVAGGLSNALVGSGRMWLRLAIYGVSGLVLVVVTALAAPGLGAMGLALGYLASYVVHGVWLVCALDLRRLARPALLLCAEIAAAVLAVHLLGLLPSLWGAVLGAALGAGAFAVLFATAPGHLRGLLVMKARGVLAGLRPHGCHSVPAGAGSLERTEADANTPSS
jgi:O-antigen/teichoic acid export membrane protein